MIYVLIIFGSIRCRFTLNLPIVGLFTEENRSVTNGTRIEKNPSIQNTSQRSLIVVENFRFSFLNDSYIIIITHY